MEFEKEICHCEPVRSVQHFPQLIQLVHGFDGGQSLHLNICQRGAELLAGQVAIPKTYDADHREEFFTAPYDFIIDAIDLVSCKLDLISQAQSRGIPIISALGTGNKLDPSLLCVSDISKTSGCPLARVMRRELKDRGIRHLPVVFSPEQPAETRQLDTPDPGRRSVPASVSWVPSCAGLMLGGYVVQALCKEKEAEQ